METFTLYINPRRTAVFISVTLGLALPYAEGVVNFPDPSRQTGSEQAAELQLDELSRIGLAHATGAIRPVADASQSYRL
jgi:hypothetical protein